MGPKSSKPLICHPNSLMSSFQTPQQTPCKVPKSSTAQGTKGMCAILVLMLCIVMLWPLSVNMNICSIYRCMTFGFFYYFFFYFFPSYDSYQPGRVKCFLKDARFLQLNHQLLFRNSFTLLEGRHRHMLHYNQM